MNDAEAVRVLRTMKHRGANVDDCASCEALDVAIAALSRPSTQGNAAGVERCPGCGYIYQTQPDGSPWVNDKPLPSQPAPVREERDKRPASGE